MPWSTSCCATGNGCSRRPEPGGEAALVTASGQGATTSLLWTLLQPGDEVIADFLAGHAKVEVVHFPGLPGFPQFDLARRQMKLPGGMVAFELTGGIDAGRT